MSTIKVNVGELRRVLREEAKNEFSPVIFGDKESAKINREAYNSIKNETEKYDGGVGKKNQKPGGGISATDNKGMHDLTYDSIGKPFMDRTKSQMKGYVSKDAEDKHKNDEFGNADFDKNGKIYNAAKDHAKAAKQGKDTASEIGLTGRELNKKDIEDNDSTMYESRNIKRLTFKTQFISEGHMLSKIPDDMKLEGKRFVMRDKANNEYLVEWHNKEPKVTKKVNMTLVNEQKNRIKELWGYKSAEGNKSTPSFRVQENKEFNDMVNKVRNLME